MKKRAILFIIFIQAFTPFVIAQTKFSNLTVKEEGDYIELHYDLHTDQTNTVYLLKAFVSFSNSDASYVELISASGDVGVGVSPGKNKTIKWDVFRDYDDVPASALNFQLRLYPLSAPLKDFSWLKGGSFIMGDDNGDEDAKPAHQISVGDFYMSKYEVTVRAYRDFCNETGHPFPVEKIEWIADHPMTFVNWYDAESYCKWLQGKTGLPFRLPTEAEWEFAAKDGLFTTGLSYSGSNNINDVGWYKQNSIGTMHNSVGKLKPNSLGIFDMSGNVWEWCADWYNSKYYSFSPSKDPSGPAVGKVKVGRGGSWYNKDVNLNFRFFVTPASRTNYLGFRVVCSSSAIVSTPIASSAITLSSLTLRKSVTSRKTGKPPELEIIDPHISRGETLNYFGQDFTVKGRVKTDSKILMTLVNGIETSVDDQGQFEQTVSLQLKENIIVVRAYDVQNRMTSDTIRIYRQLTKNDAYLTQVQRHGTDYALLIGTNDYVEYPKLANPILDIETIGSELAQHYGFVTDKVKNPTLETLYNTLRSYGRRKYAVDDQLFIFVAGHGVFDNLFGDGYLVLADSKVNDQNKTGYMSHSNLRTILNNIECNHIFLVLDVCFGGTFDPLVARRGSDEYEKANKNEFIQRKLKYKSRLYLTSGGKEYVSDGRSGMHSPFTREFLTALRDFGGADQILTLNELLLHIERVKPEPHFGEFGTNEPGSDFLFILK